MHGEPQLSYGFFKENEPLRKLIVTDFHLSDDEKKLVTFGELHSGFRGEY
jgi:hypothetical protein